MSLYEWAALAASMALLGAVYALADRFAAFLESLPRRRRDTADDRAARAFLDGRWWG